MKLATKRRYHGSRNRVQGARLASMATVKLDTFSKINQVIVMPGEVSCLWRAPPENAGKFRFDELFHPGMVTIIDEESGRWCGIDC